MIETILSFYETSILNIVIMTIVFGINLLLFIKPLWVIRADVELMKIGNHLYKSASVDSTIKEFEKEILQSDDHMHEVTKRKLRWVFGGGIFIFLYVFVMALWSWIMR